MSNQLNANQSAMGVEKAISMYPIVNSDIDKLYPLYYYTWGNVKIFFESSILNVKSNYWKLSVNTDTCADKTNMIYHRHNLFAYFMHLKNNREKIYERDNHLHFNDYAGEICIYNNLENIRKYILCIIMSNSNKILINKLTKTFKNLKILFFEDVCDLHGNFKINFSREKKIP
jgi:hypothetical protein